MSEASPSGLPPEVGALIRATRAQLWRRRAFTVADRGLALGAAGALLAAAVHVWVLPVGLPAIGAALVLALAALLIGLLTGRPSLGATAAAIDRHLATNELLTTAWYLQRHDPDHAAANVRWVRQRALELCRTHRGGLSAPIDGRGQRRLLLCALLAAAAFPLSQDYADHWTPWRSGDATALLLPPPGREASIAGIGAPLPQNPSAPPIGRESAAALRPGSVSSANQTQGAAALPNGVQNTARGGIGSEQRGAAPSTATLTDRPLMAADSGEAMLWRRQAALTAATSRTAVTGLATTPTANPEAAPAMLEATPAISPQFHRQANRSFALDAYTRRFREGPSRD